MELFPNLRAEDFALCAGQCELCAEQVSSLSPDRRLPTFLRDCGHRAGEVAELLEAGSSRAIDAAARFLNSAERCIPLCGESMFLCCRQCGESLRAASSACHEALNAAFGHQRAA